MELMMMDITPNVNHVETFVPLVKMVTDVPLVLLTELKNHLPVLVNKDTLIATMTDLAVLVLTNVTLALDLLNLVLLVLKEELTHQNVSFHHQLLPMVTNVLIVPLNVILVLPMKPVLLVLVSEN
jgi:hypothetical protein